MLNNCDFIQNFVFTTNHHLNQMVKSPNYFPIYEQTLMNVDAYVLYARLAPNVDSTLFQRRLPAGIL